MTDLYGRIRQAGNSDREDLCKILIECFGKHKTEWFEENVLFDSFCTDWGDRIIEHSRCFNLKMEYPSIETLDADGDEVLWDISYAYASDAEDGTVLFLRDDIYFLAYLK